MKHDGEWVSGRLYGASLLPQTIHLVREIKTQTSLPIIGAGGVHSKEDVEVVLNAGASAVQIDSLAWVSPDVLKRNTQYVIRHFSIHTVTGPSLMISTDIIARKTPLCMGTP